MSSTDKKEVPAVSKNTAARPTTTKLANDVNPTTTLVLQWLTYAFWGWTTVAVSYLVGLVTTYALRNSFSTTSPETIPNAVAAVVVLLVISFVCDVLYSRREVEHKTGFSNIVVVLHAVIFGLLTVGSLLSLVFSLIKLMVGSSASPVAAQIASVTAISFFLLFMMVFFRVVRPFGSVKFRFIFRVILSAIAIGVIACAIFGPIIETARTKDDRAVQKNVTTLASAIRRYVTQEAKLPASINELADSNLSSSYIRDPAALKDLAARDLIIYTPNIKKADKETRKLSTSTRTSETFYFELCAVYKYDAPSSNINYSSSSSYRSTGNSLIKAGKRCEKLEATHTDRTYSNNLPQNYIAD